MFALETFNGGQVTSSTWLIKQNYIWNECLIGFKIDCRLWTEWFSKYYYYINFDLSITIIVWIWGKCPFISKSLDSVGNVYLECAKFCEEVILLQM